MKKNVLCMILLAGVLFSLVSCGNSKEETSGLNYVITMPGNKSCEYDTTDKNGKHHKLYGGDEVTIISFDVDTALVKKNNRGSLLRVKVSKFNFDWTIVPYIVEDYISSKEYAITIVESLRDKNIRLSPELACEIFEAMRPYIPETEREKSLMLTDEGRQCEFLTFYVLLFFDNTKINEKSPYNYAAAYFPARMLYGESDSFKYERVLNQKDADGITPLAAAALADNKETFLYILKQVLSMDDTDAIIQPVTELVRTKCSNDIKNIFYCYADETMIDFSNIEREIRLDKEKLEGEDQNNYATKDQCRIQEKTKSIILNDCSMYLEDGTKKELKAGSFVNVFLPVEFKEKDYSDNVEFLYYRVLTEDNIFGVVSGKNLSNDDVLEGAHKYKKIPEYDFYVSLAKDGSGAYADLYIHDLEKNEVRKVFLNKDILVEMKPGFDDVIHGVPNPYSIYVGDPDTVICFVGLFQSGTGWNKKKYDILHFFSIESSGYPSYNEYEYDNVFVILEDGFAYSEISESTSVNYDKGVQRYVKLNLTGEKYEDIKLGYYVYEELYDSNDNCFERVTGKIYVPFGELPMEFKYDPNLDETYDYKTDLFMNIKY